MMTYRSVFTTRLSLCGLLCLVGTLCSTRALAQGSLPADWPVHQGDDAAYQAAKQAWIAAHPGEYAGSEEGNNTFPCTPTPTLAEGYLAAGNNAKTYDRNQQEAVLAQREAERLRQIEKRKQEAAQARIEAAADTATPDDAMFALPTNPSPYMEGILLRLKEAGFPGNPMSTAGSVEASNARQTWIISNEDLYQLFVWVVQSKDSKIHITRKEYNNLSDGLRREVDFFSSEYVITD